VLHQGKQDLECLYLAAVMLLSCGCVTHLYACPTTQLCGIRNFNEQQILKSLTTDTSKRLAFIFYFAVPLRILEERVVHLCA